MKVLVIKLSAFGDIIHSLPAIHDILNRPDVGEVHWLLDSRYAFVAPLLPEKVQVHTIVTKGRGRLHAMRKKICELRKARFDAVLDLQGLLKSGLIARLVNRNSFGFDQNMQPERGNAWLVKPVRFHPEERHVVQQYRRIASALAGNSDQPPTQPLPYTPPKIVMQAAQHPQQALLAELKLKMPYAILHVGGAWDTKQLPETTWLETARRLLDMSITPVFSWGSDTEQALANRLAAKASATALPKRLDISDLCELLQGAETVIGADTGVLHLAAALGCRTTMFWGPSASWRSGPLGEHNLHVESDPACGPCFQRSCNNFICMDHIQAEELLQNLDQGDTNA